MEKIRAKPPLQHLLLILLIALIALCVLWESLLAPLASTLTWPWLVMKALPLALALPGFAKDKLYTYKWMSLAIWLYFIEGTVRGWSDPAPSRYLAWCEALLAVGLFIATVVRVRQLRKQLLKL